MLRSFLAPLLLCGLTLLTAPALAVAGGSSIDLTPVPLIRKVDGATQKVVSFRGRGATDRLTMEYTPPWAMTGSGDEATMYIPGTDAVAGIYRYETPQPLDLQDEIAVVAWIKRGLPKELTDLNITRVQKDPLLLNGQCTVEVRLTYSLLARPIERSFLVTRRGASAPNEVFVFELQAQPRHFRDLHRQFQASLYSVVGF